MSCPSKVLFVEKTARYGKSGVICRRLFGKLCFNPQKGATNKKMKESSSLRWIAFVRPAVGLFAVLSNRKLVRENRTMKNYKIAVAGTGARDIIRGCHNRDKGTAENERLRNLKFIFSYPKNERLIFLGGRNAAQEEISTMRVG